MTATKTTTAPKTFFKPRANGTRGSILEDVRTIVSKATGQSNFVLVFEDGAEVVMPGTWVIREQDFPNGIYQGQKLAAYWEADEEGIQRFNLFEVE